MKNQSKTQRILVVDDVVENVDILVEALKGDYKMVAALDGEKALKLAHAPSPPDLILLDIMMPGMDGYEVCRQLKADQDTSAIPIVFLTSLNEERSEAKGLQLGAVDYITKPFNPDLVRTRVRNHIALKRHQDHLEELVENRTAQLEQANNMLRTASLDTIYRLSIAAEYRDQDTGSHILRMSHYTAAIARKLGLDGDLVESIMYAVPMHDIGKIGIPDRILLKPGKLTPEEFGVMKRHTTIGVTILSNSEAEFIRLAETIALNHHEKWDGSGYPNGLKGTEIPMVGRISAVSDVFDALTTKRPYKEAFPVDRSLDIMRDGRGSHFSPEAIDAFFDVEDEILSIRDSFPNERDRHPMGRDAAAA